MTASSITMRASTKNQPYPNTKMWLRITAVIQTTVYRAPNLAVFGIRSRTATTVSNIPDPSRNTGCDTNPWTACDICVNRVTESGTPANFKKMAAYRRFTDTNRRIASNASLLPIKSCLLDHLEPANASRMVVLISAFTSALEVLRRGPDDDLVDLHLRWLLD